MTDGAVLITGATSGIGHALALAFAEPGRHLFLLGRDASRMNQVRDACKARGAVVEADLVDVRDRRRLSERISSWDGELPIGLLIANAEITSGLGTERAVRTPAAIRAIVEIDLVGVINTVEPALGPMMKRRRGQIAMVGSLAGLRGLPSSPAYSAAKAGVHAYAEGMRPRLARHGIAVSIIAPGFVSTPLNRDIVAPRPLQMTADRAAQIIRRGLERKRPMIAFPLSLYVGLRLLSMLPARLGDVILDRPGIEVPETRDTWRNEA